MLFWPLEHIYSKSSSVQVFRNTPFLACPLDPYSIPQPFVTDPSVWLLLFFPHTPLDAFLLTQSYATHHRNIRMWTLEMQSFLLHMAEAQLIPKLPFYDIFGSGCSSPRFLTLFVYLRYCTLCFKNSTGHKKSFLKLLVICCPFLTGVEKIPTTFLFSEPTC